MSRTVTLLVALAGLTSCAPLQRLVGGGPADHARSVTITRDEWGVPLIHGASDAAALFGLAYAMAEDNYWQIEEDHLHALGRAAHWYGPEYMAADMVHAAFEVERLSREEYEREPRERKLLWQAFTEGLNHYLRTSGERPRLIANWEPWMLFARARSVAPGTVIDGVRLGATRSIAEDDPALAGTWDDTEIDSAAAPRSIMWAVGPARTASGHALLLESTYAPFLEGGQRYEAQIASNSGWSVRGFGLLGAPVLRGGHNDRLAWGHTESDADAADVYEITFDHPTDPLLYRHGGEWRRAEEWQDTLLVNTDDGVRPHVLTFRRSHHGPIVAQRADRALAMRIARMQEGGSLQQWHALGRARSLDEFRSALAQRALAGVNTLYADVAGNVYYLHGNAVPVRDTTLDARRPLDGSSADADWRGYHAIADLPQLLNPASGWILSAGSPFQATAEGQNLDPAGFPAYMAQRTDVAAMRTLRRTLATDSTWTFDAWARTAYDATAARAADEIAQLAREWEEVGGRNPERARALDAPLDSLRAWDHVAGIESTAATLFVLWQERLRRGAVTGELQRFRALEGVLGELERTWGTHFVAWGEVNRLQRVPPGAGSWFDDDAPSLAIAGAPGFGGAIFRVDAERPPGARGRYATAGRAWIRAVELAPDIRSRSIVPFGQSGRPESRHFFDQAELLARGELKPAHSSSEAVPAAARRTYSPPPQPR